MALIPVVFLTGMGLVMTVVSVAMNRDNKEAKLALREGRISEGTVLKVSSQTSAGNKGVTTTHIALVDVPDGKRQKMTIHDNVPQGTVIRGFSTAFR